jgi:hypothetical protein
VGQRAGMSPERALSSDARMRQYDVGGAYHLPELRRNFRGRPRGLPEVLLRDRPRTLERGCRTSWAGSARSSARAGRRTDGAGARHGAGGRGRRLRHKLLQVVRHNQDPARRSPPLTRAGKLGAAAGAGIQFGRDVRGGRRHAQLRQCSGMSPELGPGDEPKDWVSGKLCFHLLVG